MTVPVNQRSKNKLEVSVKSRDLATYTLQITKNKKIFIEDYQTAITDKIIATALNIHSLVWAANNILVKSKEDLLKRQSIQSDAIAQCYVLLSLIDIAKPLFHLASKRVMYWGGKVIEVRNLIRNWKTADKKRYSQFI